MSKIRFAEFYLINTQMGQKGKQTAWKAADFLVQER
jgi:hypothetical protein